MGDDKKLVPRLRFKGTYDEEGNWIAFTDDWEQRKLEDIVEFLDTLRKPLEGAKRVSGPYPYYGASGIVDYVDGYIFDEELVLLSEDGANITDRNYPVCFLASGKYWVNNHAHVLKVKAGNENNFICNSLERKDYKQYNTGMAMPKLNQEVCRNIPVSCPSFDEQKKIGDYFRSLDNLITLHQRKCDTYKKMKKGMMQKLFNQKVRFKKDDGSDYADWVSTPLKDCLKSISIKKKDRDAEIYSVSNVSGFIPQTEQFDGRDNIASSDTKNYKLVSKGQFAYNPSRINVGSLARLDSVELVAVSPLYVVFEIIAHLDTNFLLNWFDTHEFKCGMIKNIEGGVRDSLAYDGLTNISITHPLDIEEQTKIANCLSKYDELIKVSEQKLEAYKKLKKAMLQKMFC